MLSAANYHACHQRAASVPPAYRQRTAAYRRVPPRTASVPPRTASVPPRTASAMAALLAMLLAMAVFLAMAAPPNLRERMRQAKLPADGVELGATLFVSEPCIGLGGASEAASQWGVAWISTNVFDKISHCYEWHKNKLGSAMADLFGLGPRFGDLMLVPLALLVTRTHGVVSGPPCPPWASFGCKRGRGDHRASVFERILEWIEFLAAAGWLLFVFLENVPGIGHVLNGVSYLSMMLARLRRNIPWFVWRADILRLEETEPQFRTRMWLRGLRRDCCDGEVPPPLDLEQLPRTEIEAYLDSSLPNIDPLRSILGSCDAT